MDAVRVVGAQGVILVGGYGDVARGSAGGFESGNAGVSALALRLNNQDWVYKFDITGNTATLMRRYRVGLGDNPAGSSIGALTRSTVSRVCFARRSTSSSGITFHQ